MMAQFADSYVHQLFSDRDLGGLYHLIRVAEKERRLSDEFWLFCRIYEWATCRSGVWQYYEGLPQGQSDRIVDSLRKFGLAGLADVFVRGSHEWHDDEKMAALDEWLTREQHAIHDSVFRLIEGRSNELKGSG